MAIDNGDTVRIEYTGKLTDGTVFDQTEDNEPFQFKVGSGDVIPGFEEAIIGMEEEQEKTVTIKASDAYGDRDESRVQQYSRDTLPDDFEPQKGQVLALQDQEGRQIPVSVVDFNDENITVDLNHPLAGEDLVFEIKVLEVE